LITLIEGKSQRRGVDWQPTAAGENGIRGEEKGEAYNLLALDGFLGKAKNFREFTKEEEDGA